MVRKTRRSPQWNSEMQMVPLKPRESGVFVIVGAWLHIMPWQMETIRRLLCAERAWFSL